MFRTLIGLAISLGLVLAAGQATAAGKQPQYVGVKKCRSCHKKELIGNQYGAWQDGAHSKAFDALKSEEAVKIGKERGLASPPHEAEECLKCHVTAYGAEAELVPKPLKRANGVQCESCHGPGKAYRKKKVMSDHDKSVAKGMWEPGENAEICTGCHNDESPSWDPSKFTVAGGGTVGFDFDQAKEKIEHPIPEDVKGHYVEIVKKRKAERRAAGGAVEDDEEDEE